MVEYTVKRTKGRKHLVITIDMNGNCIVKTPWNCPKSQIERFVSSMEGWIIQNQEAVSRRIRYRKTEEEKAELRRLAKEILPQKVAYYCSLMGIEPPSKISINSAAKRFGSCTSERHMNFSLYLMLYPDECIDYVVVHEIAHLTELNHSERFWAIVESVLPDYEYRRDLLMSL